MQPLTRSGPALAALLALAANPGSAAIEGRLTGPDGEPRSGTVRVLEKPDDPGSVARVLRAGEDGQFEVDGTGDAPLWVRVESPGLQPVVLKDVVAGDALDVRLEAGSTLQGRVVDLRNGNGVADATVWVCDRDARRFGFDACAEFEAGTKGRFAVTGVPQEPVRLGAASPEHAFAAIELPARRADNEFHLIELDEGAPLSGIVVDDRRRPVAGARIGRDSFTVPFTDATEVVFDPPLITDENGEFRHPGVEIRSRWVYRGLADGWYGVPSDRVAPVKGTRQKLELALERPATLQFGLAAAGGDLVQPRVRLVHRTAATVRSPRAEAGTDGRYRLSDLPTIPVELKLTIEGYQPLDLGEVPLGPGKTVDLGNLSVVPGVAFSATVVDDDGSPIENSWIELAYSEPVKHSYRQVFGDGAFRFEGLPSEIEIRLTAGADGFDALDETLTLDSDTEQEITLAPVASVRGRVLGPDGEPVSQFALRMVNQDVQVQPPSEQDVDAADGRFFVWPIETVGRHTIEIFAAGFKVKSFPDVIVEEQRGVDVGDIHLELGHTVEGFAARPDGSPAEGGRVWLAPRSGATTANSVTDERSFAGWADRDGRYTITGLSPGFFIANAQHPEFAPWSSEFELVEDAPTLTLDVEFSEGGAVHGYARDRSGAPVADVGVGVECPAMNSNRSSTTDPQGYYRVTKLPDAQCRVHAFVEDGTPFGSPRLVTVIATRESRVDFDLSGSIELSGVVRIGGRIAERGFLTFHTSNSFPGSGVASARVDRGTGRYRAELSEPGEYRVLVETGGARQVVKIRIGNERSVQRDFDIPVNSIRGRVVDTDGNPLAGVGVRGSNAQLDQVMMMGLFTMSNQEGRFELKHLEPGTYTVAASRAGYRPARSDPIRVLSDTRIDNIELILDESSAQIRGRLVDPRGVALPEGFVVAAPAGSHRLELAVQTGVRGDGTFVLDVPADGVFDITALAQGWAPARASGVLPSDDKEITLQTGFGGRIAVTVLDRNGAPKEGVVLKIRAEPEWLASGTLWMFNPPAVSGPDGIAVVQHIPEGTYRVTVPGGASGTVSIVEGGTTELRLRAE